MSCYNYLPVLISLFSLLSISQADAQKEKPVGWTFEVQKLSESEMELTAIATMKPSWVIYSQFTEDDGPIPTGFYFDDNTIKFEELSQAITEFDDMFGVSVTKFKDKAIFKTKFTDLKGGPLKGYVTYMTCDGAKCLPPADVEIIVKW
jgi:hypothetical protein